MTPRKKPPFIAQWDSSFQRYAFNQARKWAPSFAPAYTKEDLAQEAYIVFMECKQRYQSEVTNVRWFMSLYKTSLQNRFRTLYNHRRRHAPQTVPNDPQPNEQQEAYDAQPAETENAGMLLAMLEEAPKEVQEVIKALFSGSTALDCLTQGDAITNKDLCGLIKVPAGKRNLVKMLTVHLSQ